MYLGVKFLFVLTPSPCGHLPYILYSKTPRKATGHGAAICKEYGGGTYGSVSWTKGGADLCHTLMSFFFRFIYKREIRH